MKKKIVLWMGVFIFCITIGFAGKCFSQDEGTSGTDWRQELSSDKQAIQEGKQAIREHADAAKQAEEQLRQQIKDAKASGDMTALEGLQGQLQSLHQQNVQQRQEDKRALHETRQEFKGDQQSAKEAGYRPPLSQNPPGYNPPGQGPANPPGYNPPGRGPDNPPGYNPPGRGAGNPPGYNPPGRGSANPPGYNPPGRGSGNPPGYNPPGKGPVGPKAGGGGSGPKGGRR